MGPCEVAVGVRQGLQGRCGSGGGLEQRDWYARCLGSPPHEGVDLVSYLPSELRTCVGRGSHEQQASLPMSGRRADCAVWRSLFLSIQGVTAGRASRGTMWDMPT